MYTITKAQKGDVESIRQVVATTYWATYAAILKPEQICYMLDQWYNSIEITRQITDRTHNYLLLKENDGAVAFADYSISSATLTYRLEKLYCLPETQGKGYGRILIDTVSRIASQAGATRIILNVNRDNNAVLFYKKMGFEILREEQNHIGMFTLNDYVMCKSFQH